MKQKFNFKEFFRVDAKTQQEEQNRPKTKKLFRKVYGGAKLPWGKMIFGWIIVNIAIVISSLQTESLTQFASGNITDMGQVIAYAIYSLLAWIVSAMSVSAVLGEIEVATKVRYKLWNKIMRLPLSYFDKESQNRIISRVTQDATNASMPFMLIRLTLVLFTVALTVILVSSCNNTMLLIMLGGTVMVLLLMILVYPVTVYAGYINANRLSVFTAFLTERLANIKLIKASKAEESEMQQGEKIVEMRYKAGLYNVFATTLVSMASSISSVAMYVACFLVGAMLIRSGVIRTGAELNAAYIYGGTISVMLAYLGQIPTMVGAAAGNMQTIAAIHDEPEENVTAGGEAPQAGGDLRMEQVGFAYAGGRQVLENVTCVIPQGKVTAIVGPNGAGKSTLIKLIDRLYTDYSGNLYVGETRAEDVSLNAWREQFAIVSQNASLFSGSIRDNICYGAKGQPSLEEISRIASLANLDEVIARHPEGLDYDIGIGGCRLSGGEQQRLSIARAMMKDSRFLILDEATANLDAKTESLVKESIALLMKGRTVITIAHNFSAIERADNILVLNNGEIEGCGTHEQLLQSCAFYKKLASAGYEI